MKYPSYLTEQGTIGFVAPSFGCAIEPYKTAFAHALENFREKGFQIDLGPNCYELSGIGISNSPQKCAEEFVNYYRSNRNEALVSCGGGELMCEILDDIDFEALKEAKPKWFMGYSDNTNLTFLLTTLCDTATFYGPNAAAFGMEPWHNSIRDAFEILQGKRTEVESYGLWEKESLKSEGNPLATYNCTQKLDLKVFLPDGDGGLKEDSQVRMKGRLIGGCMDCLINLIGTQYDHVSSFLEKYKEDGFLWFLEACDLNVFSIRRAMWQMEHAGWFQYIKGFLIGRPLIHGQEMMGLDQYDAVFPIAQKLRVPLIMDADLGHLPPAMTLITGSVAEMKVMDGKLTVKMECR